MNRSKAHAVRITIAEIQKGNCPLGGKTGDSWLVQNDFTPSHMCQSAFTTPFPTLRAMRYGVELPRMKGNGTVRVSYPDPDRVVVYELRRIPDQS